MEARIVAEVERGVPAALGLLERAVNVNSGTFHLEGVRAVGELLRPELEALGFAAGWVDGSSWGRAGHLVAGREGRPGAPRVLLIGHLDTVFEKDHPFQRFERLSESAARGPGVLDMKGGDVVMLLALRALHEAGALESLSVRVVLTGDEESSGKPWSLSRRDLVEAAEWAEVALAFEDGDGDPAHAVTVRRGSCGWTLRVRGRSAHSSLLFTEEVGAGAIYEAARIVNAFRDSLASETHLTVNAGLALGGESVEGPRGGRGAVAGKTNIVPAEAVVAGDLRAVSPEQLERVQATMRRIAAASLPRTSAELVFSEGYAPLAEAEGNRALLALYDRVSRDLGHGPVTATDPRHAGAADISFVQGRVDRALDGLGLKGSGGHTDRETADLRTLPLQARRAAVLLWRLAAERE